MSGAGDLAEGRSIPKSVRIGLVLMLLYAFLVGVKGLESGIKVFGEDFTDRLFDNVTHPLAGLAAGLLATALVQSSSVTTSTIVGLVGSGALSVPTAVPMIMGANIGTTITNTLVAIGHIRQGQEFRRAFAGATVHDFFNVLTVLVALPLELATGFLSSLAGAISAGLAGGVTVGEQSESPIKAAVAYPVDQIKTAIDGWSAPGQGTLLLSVGIVLVFSALVFVTRNMKAVMAGRIEQSMNSMLDRGAGAGGILVGLVVTMAVQSSSITTSILVPMVGAGILSLKNAYPVTLGCNVGTTITALLASLAAESPNGLTIALAHTLFNVFGILVFYAVPVMRQIPIRLATSLGELAQRRKRWVLGYVVGVFVVLPLVILVVFS